MSPPRTPRRGQAETLPGISAPFTTEELARRRAFATITRPEYWGEGADEYSDITDQMIALASPDLLAKSLTGPNLDRGASKQVVDYECDDGRRQRVALNAAEYSIIPRSINLDNLGSTVASATRKGKYGLAPLGIQNEKVEEKQRATFLQKYKSMQQRITVVSEELRLLASIHEAASTTFLNRGRSDNLRIHVGQLFAVTMPNMLQVIAVQRGWTQEQHDLAHRSLKYRLFFTTPEKKRMEEFQALANELQTYNRCKIAVFRDRMGRIEGRFGKEAVRAAVS